MMLVLSEMLEILNFVGFFPAKDVQIAVNGLQEVQNVKFVSYITSSEIKHMQFIHHFCLVCSKPLENLCISSQYV